MLADGSSHLPGSFPSGSQIRPTKAARYGPPSPGRPHRPPLGGGRRGTLLLFACERSTIHGLSCPLTFGASEPAPTISFPGSALFDSTPSASRLTLQRGPVGSEAALRRPEPEARLLSGGSCRPSTCPRTTQPASTYSARRLEAGDRDRHRAPPVHGCFEGEAATRTSGCG